MHAFMSLPSSPRLTKKKKKPDRLFHIAAPWLAKAALLTGDDAAVLRDDRQIKITAINAAALRGMIVKVKLRQLMPPSCGG